MRLYCETQHEAPHYISCILRNRQQIVYFYWQIQFLTMQRKDTWACQALGHYVWRVSWKRDKSQGKQHCKRSRLYFGVWGGFKPWASIPSHYDVWAHKLVAQVFISVLLYMDSLHAHLYNQLNQELSPLPTLACLTMRLHKIPLWYLHGESPILTFWPWILGNEMLLTLQPRAAISLFGWWFVLLWLTGKSCATS